MRVTAKGATPAALPNFSGAADGELLKLLEHSSSRIRLEAQRTILRRAGNRHGGPTAFRPSLEKLAADPAKPLASRVASLFALKLGAGGSANRILVKLAS